MAPWGGRSRGNAGRVEGGGGGRARIVDSRPLSLALTILLALVFDLADSRHVWVAPDEGVFESNDGGSTWHAKNDGLCTTQCYTVAVGTSPYRRAITTQDNRCYQAEGTDDFRIVLDRLEGGWVDYDPGDSGTVYLDTRNTQGPWPMRRLTLGPSGEPLSVQALHRRHRSAPRERRDHPGGLAIARTRPAWLLVVTSAGRLLGSTDREATGRRC